MFTVGWVMLAAQVLSGGSKATVTSPGRSGTSARSSASKLSSNRCSTAVSLDAKRQQKLAKALSQNLGLDVEVKVIVDPSVIGGAAVRVGDTVIDGTVRHRLDQLREGL